MKNQYLAVSGGVHVGFEPVGPSIEGTTESSLGVFSLPYSEPPCGRKSGCGQVKKVQMRVKA